MKLFPGYLIAVFAVIFLTMMGGACSTKPDLISVRLASDLWVGYGPFSIAKEEGFFTDEGLDVDLITFSEMNDSVAAFQSGKVDAIGVTLLELLLMADRGVMMQVPFAIDYSSGSDGIVAKKNIGSTKDLAGKRIGVEINTVGQYTLMRSLQMAGLDEKQITVVAMGGERLVQSFADGTIDAAASWEPYLTEMMPSEGRMIFSSRDIPGEIIDVLAMREEFVKTHPEVGAKLRRAWFRALDFIVTHRDRAYKTIAHVHSISAEDLKKQFDGITLLNSRENNVLFSADGQKMQESVDKMGEFLFERQLIKQKDVLHHFLKDRP